MTRTQASAAVLALATVLSGAAQTPPVAIRFHHIHYRTADPGAALGDAAALLTGVRAIAPGLGVGVRVGREYVLFDREETGGRSVRPRAVAPAYDEAARWLMSQGVAIQPATLAATAVATAIPGAIFDHVAFAADDLDAVLRALRATPASRSQDAARFRLRSGLVVEIVRDVDRPDAFWCPMHPDIRSPVSAACPICGMALVAIPPPRVGEYRLDVTLTPRPGGGASGAKLAVRDPDSNEIVTAFHQVHERPFHLFVISRDLERFAHLHPAAAADGSFDLRDELDPGVYIFLADFVPAGGTSQLVHRAVVTPGYSGPLFAPPPEIPPLASEQVASGLRIRLDAVRLTPRRASQLVFTIADAVSGQPVVDLEPYLGAAGHLLVVNADLTAAIHGHPEGAITRGPSVTFDPMLPAPGRYKLWLQVQRRGTVITAPFVIDVREIE
ncbi:MAG TPA: heavy metal-binding domain-containing protein [Vicinamibacterales bacterium]|nr:heavy metal-binding domain-containing protein [Vicinamibacterales bacterium]